MKFFKYGITLERLRREDIEMVRQWRNSDRVRNAMNYRDFITPEQQQTWFESVNNDRFHYVVIGYNGVKIGLLNDKEIDWENRTSETGIFIGRPEFFHTFVPYLVSVAGIETLFYFIGWKKQYAHILRSNPDAVNFNLQLGYRLCPGQGNVEHQRYELTRESFELSAGKIRKMVRSVAGTDSLGKILFEPRDYESGIAARFEKLILENPGQCSREETNEGVWYIELPESKSALLH